MPPATRPIVRGWINYYGRFYGSQLLRSLDRIKPAFAELLLRDFRDSLQELIALRNSRN